MNQKAKSQFRVVDNQREHNLDYARRKVKQWRSDAERNRLPVTTTTGATPLPVDDILRRALPPEPEVARRSWWRRLFG